MNRLLVLTLLIPFLFSCGDSADDARMDTVLALSSDLENGKTTYGTNCAACHGADGGGTSLGSNIKSENNASDLLQVVLEGKDTMRSYADLSDQELADVTAYAQSL